MFVTINISLVCVVGTMHVSTQMIVVAILLTYGALTNQTPVENITVDLVPPSETTVPILKNCTTGHGTPGGCVDRLYCDYGTPAIDFTSYAPKGYRNRVFAPYSADSSHWMEPSAHYERKDLLLLALPTYKGTK